ncbi:MAG: hypothetical protein ACHWZW_20915 [Spirulina sp.]
MPITPDPPFPKEKGHPLRSRDWNQLVNEVQRLDTSKVNRNGRDFVQGPLSIASSLGVGIGNTVPRAPLHLAGGNWDVSNTEGDLRIGSDTLRLKIGVALGGGGAGDARIRAVGGTNRLMLGSGNVDTLTLQNENASINSNLSVSGQLSFGAQTRQMVNLWNTSYGIGVQSSTTYFRTGGNFAWYRGGSHSDNALNSGGGTAQMILRNGLLEVAGDLQTNAGLISDKPHGSSYVAFSHRNQSTAGGYALLQHNNGTTYLNAASDRSIHFRVNNSERMTLNDSLSVRVPLVISGAQSISIGVVRSGTYGNDGIRGEPNLWLDARNSVLIKSGFQTRALDVAERFHAIEKVEKGDVVVLGGDGDTVLKCRQACDSAAIGIVSEDPGFILGMNSSHPPVALCGRVPCKVDADIAPIQVGDLLTTSATPGHAQKILDQSIVPGAIIGKAMASLEGGKGEILVFVMMR